MNNSHAHQFILYIYQDQDLSSSQETSGTTNAKSPEHISFTDDSPCIYPYTKYQAQRPFLDHHTPGSPHQASKLSSTAFTNTLFVTPLTGAEPAE